MEAQPDRVRLRELATAVVWNIAGLVEARRRPAYRHDRDATKAAAEAINAVVELLRAFYAVVRR